MKNLRKTIISIIITSAFLVSCSKKIHISCGISEASQIGINHLQPLVDAMEKYKTDNGKYPVEVDISPKYIDKIPIISSGDDVQYDESKFNVLKNKELRGAIGTNSPDGNYFSLRFTTDDDRICLTGKANICEYTSKTKQWICYQ